MNETYTSLYQLNKRMDEDEDEYLIVKWSINKIYTIIENFKCVKISTIVTCYVNYTKDIGEVIFVGSKDECRRKLDDLNKSSSHLKDSLSSLNCRTEPKLSLFHRLLSTSSKSLTSVK